MYTQESTRACTVGYTFGEDATERLYLAKRALNALDMQLCIRDAFVSLRTSMSVDERCRNVKSMYLDLEDRLGIRVDPI